MNKVCTGCDEQKPLEDFSVKRINKGGKKGYFSLCNPCLKTYRKKYRDTNKERYAFHYKSWKVNYRKEYNVIQTRWRHGRKDRRLEWIKKQMGYLCCKRCKYEKTFSALHFHHNNPEQKENSKDVFKEWMKFSEENFRKKIIETDLTILCANCHIELHQGLWDITKI